MLKQTTDLETQNTFGFGIYLCVYLQYLKMDVDIFNYFLICFEVLWNDLDFSSANLNLPKSVVSIIQPDP